MKVMVFNLRLLLGGMILKLIIGPLKKMGVLGLDWLLGMNLLKEKLLRIWMKCLLIIKFDNILYINILIFIWLLYY